MASSRSRSLRTALLLCTLLFANLTFAYTAPSWNQLVERQDSNLTVSTDGSCGGTSGFTCQGSEFGNCCSEKGWCGSNETYCGTGCQGEFGTCPTLSTSTDGSCGGPTNITCVGSEWGDCCSARGYCGGNSSYCAAGCQSDFGKCGSSQVSSDGTCGGPQGTLCQGSDYGNCCSERGYCGANASYCGSGCQSKFGTCFPSASTLPVDLSTALSSALNTATAASATSSPSTTPAPIVSQPRKSISGGAIGGIVVGTLGGIAIIGAGFFLLFRRKKSWSERSAELPSDTYRGELSAYDPAPKYEQSTWAAKELPVQTSYEMAADSTANTVYKSPVEGNGPLSELSGDGRNFQR